MFFPLLKAFRILANEGFFGMKAEVDVVLIEDWDEWPNGRLGFVKPRMLLPEWAESTDALESPRAWWKKLRSPCPNGVAVDGEYTVEPNAPNPLLLPCPNAGRPNGMELDPRSSSSKSVRKSVLYASHSTPGADLGS